MTTSATTSYALCSRAAILFSLDAHVAHTLRLLGA